MSKIILHGRVLEVLTLFKGSKIKFGEKNFFVRFVFSNTEHIPIVFGRASKKTPHVP